MACARTPTEPAPKHSTSRWRRQAPSLLPHLDRCDGRRQAPEPTDHAFKVAITSSAIFRAAAVSVPGTLMAPTTGCPPPP